MIGKRALLANEQDSGCKRCVLWQSAVNVCVFGRGSPNSGLMLVGEAPGEAESRTGRPFMGRSGQLLQSWLDELELRPYITNVVKCRPPDNRTPTVHEADLCYPYLLRELEVVDPRVIVALGRTAMRRFGIKARGIALPVYKWQVIGTYHPAYALRTRTAVPTIKRHLKQAKELLRANLH